MGYPGGTETSTSQSLMLHVGLFQSKNPDQDIASMTVERCRYEIKPRGKKNPSGQNRATKAEECRRKNSGKWVKDTI